MFPWVQCPPTVTATSITATDRKRYKPLYYGIATVIIDSDIISVPRHFATNVLVPICPDKSLPVPIYYLDRSDVGLYTA